MNTVVTRSPGKTILCGEFGVNRGQPAIASAVSLFTTCRVSVRTDGAYRLRSGDREEFVGSTDLAAFKVQVDRMIERQDFDEIRSTARDFFAPSRYVLAHLVEQRPIPGLDVVWSSDIPISSGLGSGAAACTSMTLGVATVFGSKMTADEIIETSWKGDIIAHGGVASSLDTTTIVHGGLIRYSVENGAEPITSAAPLDLVIGNVDVPGRSTASLNTKVRLWLDAHPAKSHLFTDMRYLVESISRALGHADVETLGHLFNLHQLIQDKLGTSVIENEALIEAAIGAGAAGAKISGAGGGGIIIALADIDNRLAIRDAIENAGGTAYLVRTGVPGVQVVTHDNGTDVPQKEKHS